MSDTPENPPLITHHHQIKKPIYGDCGKGFEEIIAESIVDDFTIGITLRDYFAAAALTGMYANGGSPKIGDVEISIDQAAYAIADHMLKTRRS